MKRILALLTWITLSIQAYAAHQPGHVHDHGEEVEGNIRLFYNYKPFRFLLEYHNSNQLDHIDHQSIKIGGYYPLKKQLKLGFFYKRQRGVRHDEDWVIDQTTGNWIWEDTNDRDEDVFHLDFNYKRLFELFDIRNFVFGVKNTLMYNTHNDNLTYRIRPGITYFIIRDTEPFLNFYLHQAMYFPLNFSEATFYERWTYFGMLYHYSKRVKLGPYVARKSIIWTSHEESPTQHNEREWSVKFDSFVIGFNVLFFIN